MNTTARADLIRLLRNHGLTDVLGVLAETVTADVQTLLRTNAQLDKAVRAATGTVPADPGPAAEAADIVGRA